MVTGASDGIGKEFAFSLAAKGFNLVLIARNAEKLESVKKEIREECPLADIKILVLDFNDSDLKGYEDIAVQLEGLDISILVNNVGKGDADDCHKMSLSRVRSMVNVNILSQVLMTRVVLPFLVARHKKKQHSLVIDMSSISAVRPMPYLSLYASTKQFNSFFGQCLA